MITIGPEPCAVAELLAAGCLRCRVVDPTLRKDAHAADDAMAGAQNTREIRLTIDGSLQKILEGRAPRQVVYVKGRLVNIVA